MKTFDELSPGLQQVVTDITCQLNNSAQPPEREVMLIPILKPIDWSAITDETRAAEVPRWIARFERRKRITHETGRYIFHSLGE